MTIKILIQGAKFQKNEGHLCVLKQLMLENIRSPSFLSAVKKFRPDAVCFIPSHFVTNIFRGPELSRIFAQSLAREIKVPSLSMLKRRTFNDHQAARSSKKHRLQAIKGAFVVKRLPQKFARLLVVDDIVTTGATFAEVKKVLKPLAREVRCLAIAKTP